MTCRPVALVTFAASLLAAAPALAQTAVPPAPERTRPGEAGNQTRENLIRGALAAADVESQSLNGRSLRIGSAVPRTIELTPAPPQLVLIQPAYRNRMIFLSDRRLYVVDRRSRRVREVIAFARPVADAPFGVRPMSHHGIDLTTSQRQMVLRHLTRDPPRFQTRVEGPLRIGQRLPETVRPRGLPAEVYAEIPALRGHGYYANEQQIVIVDQRTNEIQVIIR